MSQANLLSIFAKNLKDRRKKLNYTQAQLASKIGVSTSFITEIESGKKAPSFQTIEKLAAVIEIPAWTFFCNYGDQITMQDDPRIEMQKQNLREEINKLIDKILTNKDSI